MIASQRPPDDEFYIGYEDQVARGIRRRVRQAVAVAACAAVGAAVVAVTFAATLPASRFEFGVSTESAGVLRRIPYPVLETGAGRVWLVGRGKSGADAALAGVPDGGVAVRGSRIQRGRHEMLEVETVRPVEAQPFAPMTRGEGGTLAVTLKGEIVDSKCFLGVMNPAEGAVHRDCARRCLSGGIPPMLLVRDGARRQELVTLVSAEGASFSRDAAAVAGTPVEVTGRLLRTGRDYVLYVSAWKKAS